MRPRILDLFCCEGGCSRGYDLAGFTPYGIDLFGDYTQARYPYPSYRSNALSVMRHLLDGYLVPFRGEPLGLEDFGAIHASPPCQRYSITNAARRADYPDLIDPVRRLLQATGLPYVIENVVGAPLVDPVELCACMFDPWAHDADGELLRMERTRLFESNLPLSAPGKHHHPADVWVAGCYGGARKAKRHTGETLAEVAPRDRHEARYVRKGGYVPRSKAVVEELMGIDWMTWKGLHQAIPPAYAEHVGQQILDHLGVGEVAA